MPFTEKQEHLLRAIKHGFRPKEAMKNVTPAKAAEMLSHGAKRRRPKRASEELSSKSKIDASIRPVPKHQQPQRGGKRAFVIGGRG